MNHIIKMMITEGYEPLPRNEIQQFFERELKIHKKVSGREILVDPVSREVSVINLSGLDLPALDLSLIKKYPGIQHLDLNRNMLKQLDLTPLQCCKNLKELDLSCNDFYHFLLDLTPLEQCPLLEKIHLEGDITLASDEPNISKVKLGKFPNLLYLDMHQNALKEVDLSPLSGSTMLNKLDLSWNHLKKADLDQLQGCQNLRYLNLSFNQLPTFPPEACITSLRELILGHNKLTRLPGELGSLYKLETLDVSFNPLGGFSFPLANLNELNSLNLAKVTLSDAPNLGNLPSLLLKLNLHDTSQALIKSALQPFRH